MILYPPQRFDLNEWFIVFSATTVLVTALLLPKRFSPVLIIFIFLFNNFLGQTVDFILAVPPYDLYDENDSAKYEIFDLVLYFVSYPPVAYIMLIFYDRWKLKGIQRILFIGGWALLTMGLEFLADLAHVFTYKGWKLQYSLYVYVGVYTINILMLHLAQYLLKRNKGVTALDYRLK